MAQFDSIENAHNEALIAMGVIESAEASERKSPELPNEMLETYAHYKKIRFGRAKSGEQISLIPREQLTYTEIVSYMSTLPEKLKEWQINAIMDIDAIFECREAPR